MVRDEGERFQREVEGMGDDVSPDRDRAELARLLAYRPEREEAEEAKLARSRWLEANRAERSFSCGIVPDPVLARRIPGGPDHRRSRRDCCSPRHPVGRHRSNPSRRGRPRSRNP